MKKITAILMTLLMLVSSMSIIISAEGEPEEAPSPDPVYYPNGTVIVNEDIVKNNIDKFKITYQAESTTNSAVVSWNDETGRLVITGDEKKNIMVEFTEYPEALDYYTITADLYLTTNDFGKNVLIQMGSRNPNMTWGHGNLIQLYIDYDEIGGKDKAQMVDKGPLGNTVSSAVELGTELTVGSKLSLKIVVDDKIANYYINDTFINAMKVDKMQFIYGNLFFAIRSKVVVEVDNLMVYSGVGEPNAEKTILNTQPISAPDIPAEPEPTPDNNPTNNTPADNDDNNTEVQETTDAGTIESKSEETTEAAEETSGCGATVTSMAIVSIVGVAATMTKKKRRK